MKAFHLQSKSSTPSDHPRRPSHRRASVRPPAPPVSNRLGNRQLQDVTHNRSQSQPSAPLQTKISDSPRAQAWADMQARMTSHPGGVAQRQPIGEMVGPPIQRQEALEDEEEIQMQAASGSSQRQELEDEELMQGKFETAQCQSDMEEDELLQEKFDIVQRQELEDEELLQGKFGQSGVAPPSHESSVPVANRTGMPDGLKSGLEQLSGIDLSDVRVHRNSSKPSQLQALAYTQGQDIYVGPGQEQHLPHEGWHVVQQMQSRVRPTLQARGVSINDDEGLEHEADLMGRKALQAKHNDHPNQRTTTRGGNKSVPFFPARKGDENAGANHTGIPGQSKARLEQLSGMDLSGVRVHRNTPKPAQLQALAYTQGQDIHVGPGQEKHLAHEGWHVVQQIQGHVKPTMQAQGMSINDDEGLEHEADLMGMKAVQMCCGSRAISEPREIGPIEVSDVSAAAIGASRKKGRLNSHPTIQRDIGFEWETNQNTYYRRSRRSRHRRSHAPSRSFFATFAGELDKGDVLVRNMNGLHAKADEGGTGLGSNLEFETDPFPETAAGRAGLLQALRTLERLVLAMDAKPAGRQISASQIAAAFGGTTGGHHRYIDKRWATTVGNAQATVGVVLDRIAELMERGVGTPTQGPHLVLAGAPLFRFDLGGGGDSQLVGDAPHHVRQGIATYGGLLAPGPLSNELVGVCALMLTYMSKARQPTPYLKSIAPLMARTDFATMFSAVPEAGHFADNPGDFKVMWDAILNSAGFVNDTTADMFPHEPGLITRQHWLDGIPQNIDRLTTARFPDPNEAHRFFGLGGKGNDQDQLIIGDGAPVNAPILELRRITPNLPVHDFTELALGIFDFIVDLNQGGGGPYARFPRVGANPNQTQREGLRRPKW